MSHRTHPCPGVFPDAPPDPAARPLRVVLDDETGCVCLEPAEAIRLVLALKHLGSFVHWSPWARLYDEAIAHEAEWMAETLGDVVRVSVAAPSP